MQKHKDLLIEGSTKLGIELSVEKIEKLLHYLELIIKWNKVHNLTTIDDPSEGVKKHLLDSLSILSFIKKGRILDVGSGAGLPGIVIALMRDDVVQTSRRKQQPRLAHHRRR